MNIEVKSAVYNRVNDGNEIQIPFNYFTNLSAKNKIKFVNTVVDTLVDSDTLRYNGIVKDLIFEFTIIDVFTDVDVDEIRESVDVITAIEDFLYETNIIDIVVANVDTQLMESLRIAVDENIQYRTGVNPNSISSVISGMLGKFEKMLKDVNVNELVDFAKKINGISDDINMDKIIKTYGDSNSFQRIVDAVSDKNIAYKVNDD